MIKKIIYILFLSIAINSCQSDTQELPDVYVDQVVYLSNPTNIKLQSPGGWAYVPGGIRGIIVYRVSMDKFKAYERSCPHLSPNGCSSMEVEDNEIQVICNCDQTTFLLATGEPLNGASHGMKTYNTYYDESSETVFIKN